MTGRENASSALEGRGRGRRCARRSPTRDAALSTSACRCEALVQSTRAMLSENCIVVHSKCQRVHIFASVRSRRTGRAHELCSSVPSAPAVPGAIKWITNALRCLPERFGSELCRHLQWWKTTTINTCL